MNDKFNAYEYIGVIAPGAVALFISSLLFPATRALVFSNEFTVGTFGMFLILAFVVGHLLQAMGNLVEKLLWLPFGGMPTFWVLSDKQSIIAAIQREQLFLLLATSYPGLEFGNREIRKDWIPITKEIYVRVKAAGQNSRIDAFNRTYGLLRGIAAALLIAAILICVIQPWYDQAALILIVAALVALYRMYLFGVHYARELFISYLAIS